MLKLYSCLLAMCVSTCLLANDGTTKSSNYSKHSDDISSHFNPFKVNKVLNVSASSVNTASNYAGRSISLVTDTEKPWLIASDINGAPDQAGADVIAFFAGEQSQNLWTKDYGFDIPCNASIDSVTVRFVRRAETNTEIVDIRVSLFLPNLLPSTTNLANTTQPWLISTTDWETVSYTDATWGEILTPDVINDENFGAFYAVQNNDAFAQGDVQLDAVEISVCYTVDTPYDNPISYTTTKSNACQGEGEITINAIGGSGMYEYSIDEGATWQTSNTFTGLSAGDYKILVRNTDGTCTTRVVFCALGADERILQPGDAIVTCQASGSSLTTLTIENIQPLHDLYLDGQVGIDVSGSLPPHPFEWTTRDLGGDVFSVSIDNDYNIYTGATSLYNLVGNATPIVSRIDGISGTVDQIATLPGNKGIAGVEYDTLCNQLFVANLDDGKIYRLNPVDGTILSTFDPLAVDDGAEGFAPFGERVLAVTYNYIDGRLYYSIWNSDGDANGDRNTVRSVAIDPATCDFLPGTDQLEISTPWTNEYGQPEEVVEFSMPITDIEFSQDGQTMLLAESGYDSTVPRAQAHDARFLRYTGTTSSWNLSTTLPAGNNFMQYEIGQVDEGANSRGGIDFASAGMFGNCTVNNEEFIIGTGDALRGTTCFSFGCIYGFQFLPIEGGNPTNSVLVDVARNTSSQQKSVYGDMDVVHGCRVAEFCGEYDLALSKAITNAGPFLPGSTVEFTITVTNEGTIDAGNIIVTDDSAAGLIYGSMTPDANVTDNGDETFTITSLPEGTSQDIVLSYTIASDFMGTSIRNNAQITTDDGSDIDSNPDEDYTVDEDGDGDPDDDDEDGVSVLLVQVYDLTLSKAISNSGPYGPGSTVEFTITVENEGSLNAMNVVVTDDSPADLIFQSMTADANLTDNGNETFTIASLAANATQDIVVTYMISNTFMGTSILNQAQITVDDGDDADSNPDDDYTVDEDFDLDPFDDDEDEVEVPVGQVYDLSLTKAITNSGPYSPGSIVEFTITVSNDGSMDANNIEVTDDSAAGLVYQSMTPDANVADNGNETFTITSLPVGQTQDIVVTYQISDTFMGTSIRNDAQITADDGDDTDSNPDEDYNTDEDGDGDPDDDDEDGVDVPIGQLYDLELTKTVTSAGPYSPGSSVEYTITVANAGSLDANNIEVTDAAPAGLTYAGIAANANVSDNGGGVFTITSIPASQSESIVVSYTIDANFMGSSLTNDAQITADDGDDIDSDPDTGNDVDENGDGDPDDDDEDDATINIGQVYDLELTKAVTSAGPYSAGSTVEYTITVANVGSLDAAGIEVTDAAPAGLTYVGMVANANVTDNGGGVFTIASLPNGTSESIVISYTIDADFMGTSLTNDAQITADDGDDIDSDPNTGNDVDENGDGDPDDDDEDDATINIGQVYDLELTKAVTSAGPYGAGSTVEYTITVANVGSLDAAGIEVTDAAPAGLTYVGMIANANVTDNGGGVFTIASLPNGTSESIVISYMIDADFMGTSLTNDAQITADDGDDIDSDPDTGNDVDEDGDGDPDDDDEDDATINIGQVYDLELTKAVTSAGPYSAGSTVEYTITVSNVGSLDAAGIEVTDAAPAGLTYVGMAANANVTDNGSGVFTIASIPNGQSESIVISYTIDANFMGSSLTNDAQITADDGDDIDSDPNTGNDVDEDGDGDGDDDDEDDATIMIGQVYDLELAKVVTSAGPYSPGSTVEYTITVSNEGTLDAAGIEVTDAAPAGLTYVGMVTNGNVTDNGGGVFTIASIPAGQNESIVISYIIDADFMGTSLTNDAQITADDGDDIDSDPDTGNDVDEDGDGDPDDDDEDDANISVGQTYDLSLTKTLTSAGPFNQGSTLTFDIVVSNDGSIDANNIEVTDTPGPGLTYVGMTPNGNIADIGGGVFTITSLGAGLNETIEVSYIIDADFMGTSLRNDAEITADDGDDIDSDPDTGNDVDEDGDGDPDDDDEDGLDIPVNQVFDLALTKTLVSVGPYAPGDILQFEIMVDNEGSIDANNIEVTDNAGSGLIYQGSIANPNVTDNGGGVFTILNIPAGMTEIIELSYQIDPDFTGSDLGNAAQITADDGDDIDSDPDTGNDVDEDGDGDPDDDDEDETLFPVTLYDLALIVDLTSSDPHVAGDDATFTITVFNQGNTDANNIEVVNYIPNGLSLSPNDTNGWTGPIGGSSDTYTNTIANIPAGGQATIDIVLAIDEMATGNNLTNWAEISVDDGDDIDSTPDTDNTDPFGGDNVIDNSNGDEDDHDSAELFVQELLSSIGDKVFNDTNGNGTQDAGEPGVENILVRLFNGGGFLQDLVATDANGNYLFDNLNPGDYYVEFDIPQGFDPTIPFLGNDTEEDSDVDGSNGRGTTPIINLGEGENNLSIDLGIFQCVPIGDYVWFDRDMDSTYDRDTENGINGLQIDLYRNIGGTWVFWARDWTGIHPDRTSDDGYYKFCAPPGEYYLDFDVPPTGMVPVTPNVGDEANDSDLDDGNGEFTTSTFTITADQPNCDIGAGFYPMGSIGDIVWLDNNANGVRTSDEPAMSGVLVEAYNIYNDLVASSVTDAQGRYMIDYLRGEDYYIKFYPPAGYSMTTANAVLDDDADSDVDHSNGENTTGFYEVDPGVHIPNVDAGLVAGVALPVDLLTFNGTYRQDFVALDWATASEINSDYFLVERRFHTESNFTSIARQVARGSASEYDLNDYDVEAQGVYYYRLRMVDKDGSEELSRVISVDIESARSGDISLYPNPAIDQINLDINLLASRDVKVDLFDVAGKLVKANLINQRFPKGVYNAVIDVSSLKAGVYNIVITKDAIKVSKKLIVMKN